MSSSTLVLGSIVVASTSQAGMKVLDATSTNGVLNGDYEIIAEFPSSTPQGTYTFDTIFNDGLVVQLQANSTGDCVFNWRR